MIVADTHAFLWDLEGHERLGRQARDLIDRAAATNGFHVSAITPWEIALATSKGRLRLGRETSAWMRSAFAMPGVVLEPLTPAISFDSVNLPGEFHSDPADRIIVATARALGFPLVTADRAILNYAETGHVAAIDASI